MRFAALCLIASAVLAQETKDAAYELLAKAFVSLGVQDYDAAISFFEKAAAISPRRADIRKNLAYTLLKAGDTEAAREQFGEALHLEPADDHLALEYAFLCYEARDNAAAHKAEARRIFARLRDSTDAASAATAAKAFANIDAPLAEGIARWTQALRTSPPTFSAHFELAQLAEQRDELDVAAANYKAAFQLSPDRKSVLLELARVEKARSNPEGAMAALLAASRGPEMRAAELAREQLPERYPYVYEFRNAIALDPTNSALHQELGWLLLKMSEKDPALRGDAIGEFRAIVAASPDDYVAAAQLGLLYLADGHTALAMPLFHRVLDSADPVTANRVRMALKIPPVLENRQAADSSLDPRVLGERSYDAGFLKDAKKYLLEAHEQNPLDAAVALKLGWTNNMLHDDVAAMYWFNLARQSADTKIAQEAARAYENLRPASELLRMTLWVYPLYSSRWRDVFGYGQFKTELRLKKLPLRPYASIRFVGDDRRWTNDFVPQALSESAFILAAGVATRTWHGAMAWFEGGSSISYLTGVASRDARGGVSYSKTYGVSMAAERSGWFLETLGDGVFVSRFDDDFINYSQNRAGYTTQWGPFKVQPFWTGNLVFDVKRQYWANFLETGPGLRFRPPGVPKSFWITAGAVRGVYLINQGNPRGPNFNDLRVGLWYAFTK